MNKELKPCPFCGGDAEIQEVGAAKGHYCVKCLKCWSKSIFTQNIEEAVKNWNRRI